MRKLCHRFGKRITMVHYINPGVSLNDIELKLLFCQLTEINAQKPSPVKHKLIDNQLPLATIRRIYSSMIVGTICVDEQPAGFLISPVIHEQPYTIAHAGL